MSANFLYTQLNDALLGTNACNCALGGFMHPFSVLTLSIFIAGYITARWDLVTRLYELAIFAWDHGVVTRAAKAAVVLSFIFAVAIVPSVWIAALEAKQHPRSSETGISAREQLRRRDGGLLRVFWPSDAPSSGRSGVAVGWKNSELDFFVVCVLEDVEPRNVEGALRAGILFRRSPHPIERLLQLCGNPSIQVVGTLNPSSKPASFDSGYLNLYLQPKSTMPKIYCPKESNISAEVILYQKPSPVQMQYMSLDPIPLALGDKRVAWRPTSEEDEKHKARLVQKLRVHTVVHHKASQKELLLPLILRQVNCSAELGQLMSKNVSFIGARMKRKISVGERVVESASNVWSYILALIWHFLMTYAWPVVTRTFKSGLLCHRIAAEVFLTILEFRFRSGPDSVALKDISATAQQVDIRLQQFCYWPIQYTTLRKRRDDWFSITDSHPDYIRFYNSLWLVANDVIIGIALGSFILDNAEWAAHVLSNILAGYTLHGLSGMIVWLTDWPAGLKLNNELASFLGDLFLWVMDYWSQCVENLQPFLSHLIFFIGFSSFAGASMPIALFSDLLSLLTVHIYSFYVASARIYHWQLTIIISLFHLFRGKKHNVLRNRIDSCDYDLDQLLLGTILFTLLVFLLPTVIVFYFTFAASRVVIIALKATLDTMLACLNHFPLFALMLKLKDPDRLPGGICFELCDIPHDSAKELEENEAPPTSYVALKSVSLSMREILTSYFELSQRLRQHYLSFKVVFQLIIGEIVPPIRRKSMYSLQYSMLPAQRYKVNDMWNRLNEARPKPAATNGFPKLPNGLHLRRARP